MMYRIFAKPAFFVRAAERASGPEPRSIEFGQSKDLPSTSNEKPPEDRKPNVNEKKFAQSKNDSTSQEQKEKDYVEKDEFTKSADEERLPNVVKTSEVTKPSYSGWLGGVFEPIVNAASSGVKSIQTIGSYVLPEKKIELVKIEAPKLTRTEVISRTNGIVMKLFAAETGESKEHRMHELSMHLMEFPACRTAAVQHNPRLIPSLLKIMKNDSTEFHRQEARKCLTLLGYVFPLSSNGIRILSLDGGGTRGMITLEILDALENTSGKKICEMFDYICGVSTGGIIAVYLAAKHLTIKETRNRYMEISKQIFGTSKSSKAYGLLMKNSMYNTESWIQILQEQLGKDSRMIDTARLSETPKLGIPSCIVNVRNLQTYMFRNYEHSPGRFSHFRGGTNYYLWQILQSTTAAPMYFQKVPLGIIEHQDGGVLTNNPTAIAIHEAKLLWPDEKIQCVVSVGNGRTVEEPELIKFTRSNESWIKNSESWIQIERIVDAATDTEKVHQSMLDNLPVDMYFRLNPYTSHPYTLDEIDPIKLKQMQEDAKKYVRRNQRKIQTAVNRLLVPPNPLKNLKRQWKYQMMDYLWPNMKHHIIEKLKSSHTSN